MKVLVVLVLAVFTGCHANHLNSDSPKPKQGENNRALFLFILSFGMAADNAYTEFRSTGLGNAVMEPLEEAAFGAGMFLYKVMHSLPPTTKAIIGTSADASYQMGSHVLKHMAQNHLEPMAEDAASVMEKAMGNLLQVQDAVFPYITELMERLDPIFQDIQARLHKLKTYFVKTD